MIHGLQGGWSRGWSERGCKELGRASSCAAIVARCRPRLIWHADAARRSPASSALAVRAALWWLRILEANRRQQQQWRRSFCSTPLGICILAADEPRRWLRALRAPPRLRPPHRRRRRFRPIVDRVQREQEEAAASSRSVRRAWRSEPRESRHWSRSPPRRDKGGLAAPPLAAAHCFLLFFLLLLIDLFVVRAGVGSARDGRARRAASA